MRHLRSGLDLAATMLVIAAALAVLSLTVRTWREPTQAAANARPPIPVPTTPQSLDGAALAGDPGARVALVMYSDFECPFCGRFSSETWPAIKKTYVDSGKVVAVFKHLPLEMHRHAKNAAMGADCAGEQGRFWEMHDLLFARQKELGEATVRSSAATLGLDEAAFEHCMQRQPTTNIDRGLGSAKELQINGTPTFLIGMVQPDRTVKVSQVLNGAREFDQFKVAFDSLLDGTP